MNLKKYLVTALLVCAAIGLIWQSNLFKSSQEQTEEDEERTMSAERWKAEFEMLKNPITGEIPKGIIQKSIDAALKVEPFQLKRESLLKTLPTITITSKGPSNYGGRTRAIGIDVRNSNIILAGGVSSGIYRSTDGGASWSRVTPAGQIHSLTSIAQDTRSGNQDIWYATSGENTGNSTSGEGASYFGNGIWKSTDNGATWTALANTQLGSLYGFDSDFDFISRVVVNPTNGDVLVAAGETIKRSNDGGTTWLDELGSNTQGNPGDIIYNANAGKFYAAIHGDATTSPGIWSSSDGDNWTQVSTTANLSAGGVKRIVLANRANTSGILAMYQLTTNYTCVNSGTSEVGLKAFDGTSTWTDYTDKISTCTNKYAASTALPIAISLQGGYNMCITTKPDDANIVYLGGTEIYRYSLDNDDYAFIGGSQKGANSVNLHVDNHILIFDPNNNNIIWAGNDGGIRKTNVTGTIAATTDNHDNGYTWTDRTTDYVTYQYYDADIHPTNGSTFLAGAAQDNAFTIQPSTATAKEVGPTVDGTSIAILSGTDFNTYSVLAAFQNGGLVRIDNGTQTDIQPTGKGQPFNASIYLDADNTGFLYYPTSTPSNGLLRTRNASGIADGTISSDPTTNWQELTGVAGAITERITAIDVSRNISFSGSPSYTASNTNRKMYFGTSDGKVYRLDDPAFCAVGAVPVNITPGGATGYVSDISVNPYNNDEILVTYSNYGVKSVWHTTTANSGTPTWADVEGPSGSAVELASARSAMILKSGSSIVYLVGTSTGLYATTTLSGATTSWTKVGTTEIALSVCVEMRLRTSDNKLVVATHGNGLFLLEFPVALPVELVSFDGKAVEDGNQLNWSTASEKNNRGFEIQKSDDGKSFEKIGFVAGNGTSLKAHNYAFLDPTTERGLTYYRLKQWDVDNQFEYSKIISVNRTATVDTKPLTLYPNPVVNNLTVENGKGFARIYNTTGKLLLQQSIDSNKEQINVSDLPKGIYVLNIQKADGTSVSRKFIK
jgi:hypothetical protein